MGDSLEVGLFLLEYECDEYGVGLVKFRWICKASVLDTKTDGLDNNDVCSLRAYCFVIFTQLAREEEYTITNVINVFGE